MNDEEIAQRTERAVAYFKEGYNCSQAVVMAYADRYGYSAETASAFASSFGGGMGRLREMCGAASGMFMILGLAIPAVDPNDKESKTANYAAVQRTAMKFKEKLGSYVCAEILKIERQPQDAVPEDRNRDYYLKRPCAFCVAVGASILGQELKDSESRRK